MHCGTGMKISVPLKEEVIVLCENSKSVIESIANQSYTTFEPISMKQRVMQGMDYFVKIKVDNDEYIHVFFLAKFGEHEVKSVECGQTLESQL